MHLVLGVAAKTNVAFISQWVQSLPMFFDAWPGRRTAERLLSVALALGFLGSVYASCAVRMQPRRVRLRTPQSCRKISTFFTRKLKTTILNRTASRRRIYSRFIAFVDAGGVVDAPDSNVDGIGRPFPSRHASQGPCGHQSSAWFIGQHAHIKAQRDAMETAGARPCSSS